MLTKGGLGAATAVLLIVGCAMLVGCTLPTEGDGQAAFEGHPTSADTQPSTPAPSTSSPSASTDTRPAPPELLAETSVDDLAVVMTAEELRDQRERYYDYFARYLIPCLGFHGHTVADVPSRADYLADDATTGWDPYSYNEFTSDAAENAELQAACPPFPEDVRP